MKLRLLALLFLIVFIPAGALTGAGFATHKADYLTGFNSFQTGGYMLMADVAWALPPSAARAFYNYYPFFFYLPAAKDLQGRFANSQLEHWEPWGRYAAYHAPHLESIGGLVAGGLVGILPALLVGLFKTDESTDEREQKPKQKPKPKTKRDKKSLWIGDQRMTRGEEVRHILCVGTPRSGKSQVVQAAAKVALKRREPAFVLDHNGELFSRLYNPKRGDKLISAFDKRSTPWSPLAEIKGEADCDRIAHAIIGEGSGGESSEWVQNGVTYTSACLLACLYLHKQGERVTNQTLIAFLTGATADGLLSIIGYDHLVAGIFSEGAERMLASIKGTAVMRAKALNALDPEAGFDDFSITKHVTQGDRGKSFIFAASPPDAGKIGKQLASIVTGVYVDAINKLPEREANRSWLLADEAGRYPSISGFEDGVTNGGKRGMAVVAAVQTISQMRDAYGPDGKDTLLGSLGTRVMFQTPDSETAKWMSDQIGQSRRTKKSYTNTESGGGLQKQASNSTQQSEQIEDTVLPHEFIDQQAFQAFIIRPTKIGYKHIEVRPTDLGKQIVEPYIERDLIIANNSVSDDDNGIEASEASDEPATEQSEVSHESGPGSDEFGADTLDENEAESETVETQDVSNDDSNNSEPEQVQENDTETVDRGDQIKIESGPSVNDEQDDTPDVIRRIKKKGS